LRERGAQGFDPVRFCFIEALARRAQAHGGDARRLLDGKLAELLAAYSERFEKARSEGGSAGPADAPQGPARQGALADLLDHIDRHARENAQGPADAPAELKTARYFRSTWSRLSIDRRLAVSLEKATLNAGPLNSHGLVLRSLESMRELSPDYLDRFVLYVDALLWLEQAHEGRAAERKPGVSAAGRLGRVAKRPASP
jgi:hypothetical protein